MRISLEPEEVGNLVAKAFVLEVITDKPGCTTRYTDLPGKPLQDFIIAGINSSQSFTSLAKEYAANSKVPIFKYNLRALKASNAHKSSKFINFGLLEIMFPTVIARLGSDKPTNVTNRIIQVIKSTSNQDVRYLLETRRLAWSTSTTSHKVGFNSSKYKTLGSVWDFYDELYKDFGKSTSNHQWVKQYKEGLPILASFFNAYTKNAEIIETTKQVFENQKAQNPQVAVGIISDMCAAAMFLWLSFNRSPI